MKRFPIGLVAGIKQIVINTRSETQVASPEVPRPKVGFSSESGAERGHAEIERSELGEVTW